MLSASEKKLLTAYRKLHDTNPSGLKVVLMNLPALLILSSGLAIPAILNWSIFFTRFIMPFWALLLASWVALAVLWIGISYFQGRQWRIIDEIIDWDRVNELLNNGDATD